MPTATRRVTRRPAEKPHNRNSFAARLREFLVNKAVAEAATLRNEGDAKKKVPSLKKALLEEVIKAGEKDPETGSFFYDLDEPIAIAESGQTYKRVKAEKRQGDPYLNADRARAYLTERGLLGKVEEYQYVLRLTADLAEQFAEWLKETDLITHVVSTDAVLVEDNLLALHHAKTGKKVKVEGAPGEPPLMVDERVIPEKDLDSLYDKPEATFAFKPLTS